MTKTKHSIKAFIFIAVLFFLFGGLTVMVQLLLPHLRNMFKLDYFHSAFILFFFFLPNLLFSIPTSFVLTKVGYQRGIILGLVLIALGALLFHPAAEERSFRIFMLAVFVLGTGITFLQVAANPYVSILGSESTSSTRLTFSQAFNALGTTIAPILMSVYLLKEEVKTSSELNFLDDIDRAIYFQNEALSIQMPSLFIALVTIFLALLFSVIKIPCTDKIRHFDKEDYINLLKKDSLLLAAVGIFLYVGAEVVIGSFAVNYFVEINIAKEVLESPSLLGFVEGIGRFFNINDIAIGDPQGIVAIFVTFYWGGALVGRLVGAYLTKFFTPSYMLMVASFAAIWAILISINSTGLLSMCSLLSVGVFNAIMFPTIFALGSQEVSLKTQASGILCTAIVGAGLIPLFYGYLTDAIGFRLAFLTLVVCYGYIIFFGYYKRFVG